MKTKKGVKLWNRAKEIIPGGTQLLSKRQEMFIPDQWPSYFKRAKGVDIWDLDGNHFIDMSIMGVGSCILGYADNDVNRAVKSIIDNCSMTTLCCPEEVELAEILLKVNPWAHMVRYAKTGGEAMAIAVRIARAHTGKDIVAFCGYHGWHDWYLAANLSDDKSLDGHLLPGLLPKGVPRSLRGTALPFNYNNLSELENIVESHDVGIIVMEPLRHHEPEKGFLEGVRKIADEHDIVLIFDEITSGWRMNVGGVHEIYGVIPDVAVYGKAMGNGYPIAAVVGKEYVMESAQESFISSTFWTEGIGLRASIATIEKIERNNVPAHLIEIGTRISEGWNILSKDHGIAVEVMGIPPLTTLKFISVQSQAMHTLFSQEMLAKGFLASKSVYASYSHTPDHVCAYIDAADDVFSTIRKGLDNKNLECLLKGPVAHEGFKRLT
jgi:glutamate-1-semialdehyde 2,1-aminomutase